MFSNLNSGGTISCGCSRRGRGVVGRVPTDHLRHVEEAEVSKRIKPVLQFGIASEELAIVALDEIAGIKKASSHPLVESDECVSIGEGHWHHFQIKKVQKAQLQFNKLCKMFSQFKEQN